MPGRMIAPAPMEHPSKIFVSAHPSSPDGGYLSLVKQTWGPIKTLSPIVTPSGIKANACILQSRPIDTLFPIQTWEWITVSSPIRSVLIFDSSGNQNLTPFALYDGLDIGFLFLFFAFNFCQRFAIKNLAPALLVCKKADRFHIHKTRVRTLHKNLLLNMRRKPSKSRKNDAC